MVGAAPPCSAASNICRHAPHRDLGILLKNIDSVLLCVVEQDHKYSVVSKFIIGRGVFLVVIANEKLFDGPLC